MSKIKFPVNPVDQSIYYPSLDGLRFFAFFIVFLHHSLLNLQSNNFLINYFLVIIQKNGWVGVDLFFVLSGFLITNLLLKEREKFGSFSLKNFWIRRALRIWPLYYLALLVGFFLIPFIFHNLFGQDFSNPQYQLEINKSLPYYLFFLGNWVVSLKGYSNFTNISHLWTISLEEQFYFIWPIILLFINSFRKTILIGFFILIFSIFTRFYLSNLGIPHPGIYTNTFARMDTLTIGALLALLIKFKPSVFVLLHKYISNKGIFIVLAVLIYILHRVYLFNPDLKLQVVFGYPLLALFMLYFVLFALSNPLNKLLNIKPLVWLGKISYGLYVWHILALELTSQGMRYIQYKFLYLPLAFLLTLFLGYISYRFYESKFLQFKSRFAKIKSRPV